MAFTGPLIPGTARPDDPLGLGGGDFNARGTDQYSGPMQLGKAGSIPGTPSGYTPFSMGGANPLETQTAENQMRSAYPDITGFTEYTGQGANPVTNAIGVHFANNTPPLFSGQSGNSIDTILANMPKTIEGAGKVSPESTTAATVGTTTPSGAAMQTGMGGSTAPTPAAVTAPTPPSMPDYESQKSMGGGSGLHSGGPVEGSFGAEKQATVQSGEFVVNKYAAKKYKHLLDVINQDGRNEAKKVGDKASTSPEAANAQPKKHAGGGIYDAGGSVDDQTDIPVMVPAANEQAPAPLEETPVSPANSQQPSGAGQAYAQAGMKAGGSPGGVGEDVAPNPGKQSNIAAMQKGAGGGGGSSSGGGMDLSSLTSLLGLLA